MAEKPPILGHFCFHEYLLLMEIYENSFFIDLKSVQSEVVQYILFGRAKYDYTMIDYMCTYSIYHCTRLHVMVILCQIFNL